MNIVLVEPEIPPNTGNIARLCAATGSALHLIEPLGFELNDKRLARAGLDYWKWVEWRTWPDWKAFQKSLAVDARLWFVESNGPRRYDQVAFEMGDYLVFGRETAGLPRPWLDRDPDHWVRIPMLTEGPRSLNLSNAVALVLYEALRQEGFSGEQGGADWVAE